MADLIERDNTIKEIDEHLAFVLQTYNKRYGNSDNEYIAGYKKAHEHIKEVITLKLPPAQPEITRCRDCKYRDEKLRRTSVRWLPCMDVRTGGNWYCGSAERGKQDG